jgi:cell division protein FtsB
MESFYRFLRTGLLVTLLLLSAVVVPLKILDGKGIDRVERLRAELSEIEDANRQLRHENDALRADIHAFHANPDYVEKVARDELGMVGKDEVIYQFPSPPR